MKISSLSLNGLAIMHCIYIASAIDSGLFTFPNSPKNMLYAIYKNGADGSAALVASSFDQRDWSAQAGAFSSMSIVCNADTCDLDLPYLATDEEYELAFSETTKMTVSKSSTGTLNSLVKVSEDANTIVPFARSYDGRDWESVTGENRVLSITCTATDCDVELPPPKGTETYQVNTYTHSLPAKDEVARFLEQATFGATTEDLAAFDNGVATDISIARWIEDQMINQPASQHREWFRKRIAHPNPWPRYAARPHTACEKDTRYRKYAFNSKDKNSKLQIEQIGGMFKLSVGGNLRTLATSINWKSDGYINNFGDMVTDGGAYHFCKEPEDFIGGRAFVTDTKSRRCTEISVNGGNGNIQVYFQDDILVPSKFFTLSATEATAINDLFYKVDLPQELTLTQDLVDPECDTWKDTMTYFHTHAIFNDEYYIHTPPPVYIENTLENPAPDGGGFNEIWTEGRTYCSNVPRTFLNEDTCIMTTDQNACGYSQIEGDGVMVCGSPGEIANDATTEGGLGTGKFDASLKQWPTTGDPTFAIARKMVWLNLILYAPDQLRQRIAWALNQILVVAQPSIGAQMHSEPWLIYYDIFVRNAFGNYRDILKEISYSAHMAENLSYLDSESSSFKMEHEHTFSFPDENFAREIMQLFTIGLCQLKPDGTVVYGSDGVCEYTYSNDVIMEYSRVWTGFTKNTYRGNIESGTATNHHDPMDIKKEARDMFPKLGLFGRYIGDRYPLCIDRPSLHYLKKGATFRLLGKTSFPDLHFNPDIWATMGDLEIKLELPTTSKLYDKLCNLTGGSCAYKSIVTLDADIDEAGFDVDTLRVFKIAGTDIHYEYVALPCVEQAFYNDAVKVVKMDTTTKNICVNKKSIVASTACCDSDVELAPATRNERFWGERMSFSTAESRCSEQGKMICKTPQVSDCGGASAWDVDFSCYADTYYWTNDSCTLKVKVDSNDARVSLVQSAGTATMALHVDVSSITYFRVLWDKSAGIPTVDNNCGNSPSCTVFDSQCVCEVNVVDSPAFSSIPSKEELLSLRVGAYDPASLGYTVTDAQNGFTIYHVSEAEKFTTDTIFEVTIDTGVTYFLKNVISTVELVGTSPVQSFVNPSHFLNLADNEKRDAIYETEAALDHYMYHPNTPPFLVTRFIQRFGISNASPSYVLNAATAFRLGQYTWVSDDSQETIVFGTGTYGDLAATFAAILLDPEARSVVLDADPGFGSVREPLLKLVHLLRSLEAVPFERKPLIEWRLNAMQDLAAQEPYVIESVFSYFLPEFQPSGPIADANLVSPESQLLTSPNVIGLVNGLYSLLKYGFTSAWGGFFHQNCGRHYLDPGDHMCSRGYLDFTPTGTTAEEVVDELATLMTSGRLSEENRRVVEDVYNNEYDKDKALIMAEQIIASSAEFHTTGVGTKSGNNRVLPVPGAQANVPYKAVVLVFLKGGADTFNLLVPRCEALKKEYLEKRAYLALLDSESLPISTPTETGQACNEFGIHYKMPNLHREYQSGNVVFIANTGLISVPADSADFREKEKLNLFAHNRMTESCQQMDPFTEAPGTGILGRIAGVLSSAFNVGSFSIDGVATSLLGLTGITPPQAILNRFGPSLYDPYPWSARSSWADFDLYESVQAVNEQNTKESNFFAETWSESLTNSVNENQMLEQYMSGATITQSFRDDDNKLMQQLLQVSKLIDTRDARGVDKDLFFTTMGGFDSHANMKENTESLFSTLDNAVTEFWTEMGNQGLKENVAVVVVSEFGRTLTPNSKSGTDHGWGGNYYILGEGVNGGKILGTYPDDYDGAIDAGRNRLIPSTPLDAMWNAVAGWMGVEDEAALNEILPNRKNFMDQLFSKDDLFVTSSSQRKNLRS